MKLSQLVLLAAIALTLAACTDHEAQERAINDGRAAPTQVATPGQQAEHPFAATCREVEGRWDDQKQECEMTAAACSNSAGAWQPGTGCITEMSEADCDTSFGMVFEDSKCIMQTVSPKAFEVK